MPPPLAYKYPTAATGFPRSQGLTSPTVMAMPAPASTRPYAESVTITLTSIRRMQDATRHVVLHPDEPIIIGRSSRSEFKNLSSTTDNALFDCPVVSRTHAEFKLGFNKWDAKDMYKVYITDKGSMHGTSVNGQKLQPNKPFHLHLGDVIRLGDSVAQGQNSYDGVMITLDRIRVANQKDLTQAKSGQRGISCPSGSDPDSDDDSVEEVEAPSSAQTTPDQPTEKPAAKRFAKFGSSILTGIVLDDENEPESVVAAPIINARSIVVPDTYAEDEAAEAAEVECMLQFDDAVTDYSRTVADGQQEMDEEDEIYGDEESEPHFSDDALSPVSSDDNSSNVGSSHHSFDSESDSMSDFQDDEDEQDWAEQNDLHSIHDDQNDEDEEGPEIMSSKRSQSVEIGTLGNAHDDQEYQPSDVPPYEPAAPTRPHYDPVRGMFQVAPAPLTDNARVTRSYDSYPPPSCSGVYANPWDSSKWDVGPSDLASNWYTCDGGALETSTRGEQNLPSLSAWNLHSKYQPGHTDFAQNVPSEPTVWDVSKKRKASEISNGFEPMATAQESEPQSVKDDWSQESSLVPPVKHELLIETSVTAVTEEALAIEPPPKKLKTDQPRTKKSMLRSAALEASKYTAGAIIGGIGLVTILASPLGEALASC